PLEVGLARQARLEREQRLDLGAEEKSSRRLRVHERLHAEAVAREREAALLSLAREQPQQHLGVGVAAEALAPRLEVVAQLPEVVDLAVEDDDVAAVGRVHR